MSALRPLRWPALWVAVWLAAIAAVAALSLMPAANLPPPPFDGVDKLEHFLGYALLSAYAAMLFERAPPRWSAALALIALGVGLEFAQGALTASRQADAADAVFNALGALAGQAVVRTPLVGALGWIERRVAARSTRA